MNPAIAIIDYGLGNLRSVAKALERVGAQARVIDSSADLGEAKALVLPGVGAFGQAMDRLTSTHFAALVRDWIGEDRPFLGICLGLQLLFTESEEFGPIKGLDLVPGRVVRFEGPAYERQGDRPGLKVPHIGWNNLKVLKQHPVVADIPDNAMAYFVHSYYGAPDDSDWTAMTTDHGLEFTSAVSRGNLFASQFHPEKSGDVGLHMLANFVKLVGGA
ncbi:MAG TPA: imidazole glycerol phosphate synthase subunit HisH [Armatimonadota bacterium]|nr:imidazole glycerol phosphate synthase subunit HisH [Armatimonadota bacterium]